MKKILCVLAILFTTQAFSETFELACGEDFENQVVYVRDLKDIVKLCSATLAARKMLTDCTYLRDTYPSAYLKLIDKKTKIDIYYVPVSGSICGVNIFGSTIAISKDGFEESLGCYGNLSVLIMHEMLHLIGLPGHKVYASEQEYMEKDEVEQMVKMCFMEKVITYERD